MDGSYREDREICVWSIILKKETLLCHNSVSHAERFFKNYNQLAFPSSKNIKVIMFSSCTLIVLSCAMQ